MDFTVSSDFTGSFTLSSVVNYFHKKLHLRCLAGFWMRLWAALGELAETARNSPCSTGISETYPGVPQTSKMECFSAIVNG